MYDPNDYAGEKLEQDLQYEERRALAEEEAERDEEAEREDLTALAFVDPDERLAEPFRAALAGFIRTQRRAA